MRTRAWLGFLAALAACVSSSDPSGGGGSLATGGTASTGGTVSTGGVTASGGATATGGTASSGGVTTSGGVMATGGETATGGTAATGGATAAGGATSPRRDAGSDSGQASGGAGGSGGSGGAGGQGGGPSGGTSGAGGARPDASPDAGADSRPDVLAERPPEVGGDGAPDGRATSDGSPCPASGNVTYTLTQNPGASAAEQAAYPLITTAMDKAIGYYNCYTGITKKITVTYNAGVETVDGNINGSIRFGPNTSYMEYTRAMHEISHTVGVGTASSWQSFLVTPEGGGARVWSGANATAQLRAITGVATDVIKGDNAHFWPYGLNYVSEVKSEADVINHCLVVVALRKDMGM